MFQDIINTLSVFQLVCSIRWSGYCDVTSEWAWIEKVFNFIHHALWWSNHMKHNLFRIIVTLYLTLFMPIGSPVTHENLPTNWPNFAASPALLGWPARNRHTAACIHRFSHILRWQLEPVVWFMSESRAFANEHEGYKRTLSGVNKKTSGVCHGSTR